jgi:RNA polymerase sigma-70 factor (ECF subfamily)
MKELPAGYRTIFVLHEVKGYEHHESARLLHCSVGNSKSQLHKAKTRMRELLGLEEAYAARAARSRAMEAAPDRMNWEPAGEAA